MTRKNLDFVYEKLKRAWIEKHPDATRQEYETAIYEIAKKIGL